MVGTTLIHFVSMKCEHTKISMSVHVHTQFVWRKCCNRVLDLFIHVHIDDDHTNVLWVPSLYCENLSIDSVKRSALIIPHPRVGNGGDTVVGLCVISSSKQVTDMQT